MTKQTGNDRYAGTTPQSSQQQSQSQSQKLSENDEPSVEPNTADHAETAQAGEVRHEMNAPEHMPQDEDHSARRQQASEQSDHDPIRKGFGYGAQDGEEMSDAPDASERGYGGASEEREEKLNDNE